MAYNILNTDGTTLLLLADGTIDQSTTSLTLIGKDYSGFGQFLNNNLITLLANGASSSSNPPRSPLTGQLWYDTTAKKLKVYDGIFKSVSGATVSTSALAKPSVGDLWFDTTNQQLKIMPNALNNWVVVGPEFPASVGDNGFVLPQPDKSIYATDNTVKQVTLLKNYGNLLGYISSEAFPINTGSTSSYIVTGTTTSAVKGLTILGDFQASGNLIAGNLNVSDIDVSNTARINTLTVYTLRLLDGGETDSGSLIITNDTPSLSINSGALQVAGGVGIGGTIYVGNSLIVSGNITGTNITGVLTTPVQPNITSLGTLTSLIVSGNITATGITIMSNGETDSGTLFISNTTKSTSTNTGALTINGGVGVGGDINIGGHLNIIGLTTLTDVVLLGKPPVHNTSTGILGQVAVDSNYLYVCTGTNVWSRILLDKSGW